MRSRTLPAWLLALVAACGSTMVANAAEGIFLSWNDCPLGASQVSDHSIDCDSNLGRSELLCSFSLAQAVDSVLAVEITLDVQHSAATLPPWWRFDSSPCRGGSLTADGDFSSFSACEDMWHGEPFAGGLADFTVGAPRGGANQARIHVTLAVTPERMQSLGTTATYYAARLILDNENTTGASACAGCGEPVCIVLNAVMIGRPLRPGGAPNGNVLLETPGPGTPNWVTWRGGLGANCVAVPVRRTTWGQVKALYR